MQIIKGGNMKTVTIYNGVARVGTWNIAKGFNRPHKRIVELINKHNERFLRLEGKNKAVSNGLIISRLPAKTAGRPVDEIMLNEKQAIFLGTLFRNTDIVLDFKEKLADEFVNQNRRLSMLANQRQNQKWIEERISGKIIRKTETDTIKEFIEYAKRQGGSEKGCNMYYSNITRMMNSYLFELEGKFKPIKDFLNTDQIRTTTVVENMIGKTLTEGMESNKFYKDIYLEVKSKVEMFSELTGKSKVVNEKLLIEN